MKKLILAEKPSVAKDIAKALSLKKSGNGYIEGNEYIVTWALGHLITLQDPGDYDKIYEKWDINHLPIIPQKMILTIIPQAAKQFKIIKGLLKETSEVIIATDAGREGELVARWILEYAKSKHKIKRLWISSVTNKAIKDGFANLKDGNQYLNLYYSAYSRAVADWVVGINATRALTTKFNASLSCGRVQTPTLSILAKREEDINKFTAKEFYKIIFNYKGVKFTNSERIFDKKEATNLIDKLKDKNVTIKDIKSTKKKNHVQGYDLTTLQQDANKLYEFSAKETLNYTQNLYERHKVLTYPRTDSKYITKDMVDTLVERVKAVNFGEFSKFASKILKSKIDAKSFVNNEKVTDHHAIIPTEEKIDLSELNSGERKIYSLVVKRFLQLLLPPYEYEETKISIDIEGNIFTAKGKTEINLGYREIENKNLEIDEDDEEEQNLPIFKLGQNLKGDFSLHTGKTTPPSYFTEGTLLMAMENPTAFMENNNKDLTKTLKDTGGLGTVATRADIIEKLFSAGSIEKEGKIIRTTPKGRQLLGLVPIDLRSPLLTAKWETQLLKISKGELRKEDFLENIKKYTHEIVKEIKLSDAVFKHTNITNQKCEKCNKLMLEIKGKNGIYLVCQDKECGTRKNVEITTNARCPKCKKKLTIVGDKKQSFVCICGYRESKDAFEQRKKVESNKLNKRDVQKYIQKINTEQKEETKNNNFASELSKLKF
ncbi:MAG: DNA topoisomerase III [Defluviitaleaceae bacterium]|nr:DNA topoisomerase III [Defluviitaleaceae bacterium]